MVSTLISSAVRGRGNSAACLASAAVGAGASLEQVCERLDLGAAAASRALLELELLGQLRAEPGLWWTRC